MGSGPRLGPEILFALRLWYNDSKLRPSTSQEIRTKSRRQQEEMPDKLMLQPRKIGQDLKSIPDYFLLLSSDLFDRIWYLEHNPDVAQAGRDPAWHYLKHGRKEGHIHSVPGYTPSSEIITSAIMFVIRTVATCLLSNFGTPCKHHSNLKVKWEKASLNDR